MPYFFRQKQSDTSQLRRPGPKVFRHANCDGPRGPTGCLRSIPQAGPSKNSVIEDCCCWRLALPSQYQPLYYYLIRVIGLTSPRRRVTAPFLLVLHLTVAFSTTSAPFNQ